MTRRRSGICPFCQQHLVLTDEDIVPRWLGRELRRTYPHSDVLAAEVVTYNGKVVGNVRPRRVGSVAALKIAICEPCNSRMGKLERGVSSILKPALGEEPMSIAPEDQRLIASWATLKALEFDAHRSSQPKVAVEDDYRAFHASSCPAPELSIWLARHESRDVSQLAFFVRDSTFCPTDLPGLPAGTPHAQILTIRFGHLIMQTVFIGARGRVAASDYRHPEGIEDFAVQIWPASGHTVEWPPKYSMDDASLAVFASVPEPMVTGPLGLFEA